MPVITGIAHVELSVRNLEASEAWYGRVFEMETVFNSSSEEYGIRDRAMFEPKSKLVFAFTEHQTNAGEPFDPQRTGLDHLSFAVEGLDELRRWHEHLASLGEAPTPFVEWPGGAQSFTVADPDGIAIEFFVRAPRGG